MAGIKKKVAALCLNTKQGYIRGEVSRNYLINKVILEEKYLETI